MVSKRIFCAAAGMVLCAAGTLARAQSAPYPHKPVRIVVGYAAGGATDVLARLLAQRLSETLGQSVVVENKGGANGNIAAEMVARSPADGYTLFMSTIANTINTSLYPKLGFDFGRDFAPIGTVAAIPNVMVVHPEVQAQSVKEFMALARSQPGQFSYASSGSGSSIHLSGELFKAQAGVHMVHIPYRGSAPAMTDLLGGQVQVMFDNLPSALPHIKAGRLRALAVTTARRSDAAPQIPTLAESGLPNYEITSWFGLVAPARTPKEVVAKLHAELTAAQNHPAFKDKLASMGAERLSHHPEAFATFIDRETQKWAQVIKRAGVKVD